MLKNHTGGNIFYKAFDGTKFQKTIIKPGKLKFPWFYCILYYVSGIPSAVFPRNL